MSGSIRSNTVATRGEVAHDGGWRRPSPRARPSWAGPRHGSSHAGHLIARTARPAWLRAIVIVGTGAARASISPPPSRFTRSGGRRVIVHQLMIVRNLIRDTAAGGAGTRPGDDTLRVVGVIAGRAVVRDRWDHPPEQPRFNEPSVGGRSPETFVRRIE